MPKILTVPTPKVKKRGKLPPPPAIHQDKKKKEDKDLCRKRVVDHDPYRLDM